MVKKKGQRFTAWVMSLMIGVGVSFPTNIVLAAAPASLNANVSVTGVETGGTIDGSKAVEVTVDFNVPVKGDGIDDYYQYGDTVTLPLSASFYFEPVPTAPIDLMYQSKKLGTVTLSNNSETQAIATIVFDGDEDVFDPEQISDGGQPYSNVSGQFQASLKYNGNHNTDSEGNKIVSILEKTYQLRLPGDAITYTMEKSAEGSAVNLDDGTITWTVKITATKDTEPDPTSVDLNGYVFEDDLNSVGEYVSDSFSLTGGTLVIPNETSKKLTYTFPAGAVSPQTLTFKTEIPQGKLTNGGNITNGASLYLGSNKVGFDDFKVTIAQPSVTKSGVTNDVSNGATYNPTDRTITWYIEVDNQGRTLNGLTITDALKDSLTLALAQWQKKGTTEGTWEDVSGKSWTGPTAPTDNQYVIGDVNYVGRLKIVTNVPNDTDGSVTAKTYYNQATANWTGSGGTTGSAATGDPGVGIGYNALSKNGTQSADDVKNHQITWTINTDMKGQDATDFKVYDLFVHNATTPNSDLTGATGWPAGLSIGINNITRNDGQKFVEISSKDDHLTVTPIHLQKDGKVIATLVEITGIQNSGSNQVVLKSQVLAPNIIAGNDPGQKVNNYANLYKGTIYRGKASDDVNYNNKILAKELLKRAEVGNDHATGASSINANNRTIYAADGFHYGYKEVIFRLNVNAAVIDFANIATNLSEGFGDVIVTDTLPAGWEFATFSGGQDYLIYEATGALSTGSSYPSTGSLTATGAALGSVSGLTAVFNQTGAPQTATFTFENLNKPYVILVKARPTGDTFDGYLKGINTRDETNTLSLSSANWMPGKSVTQKVTVNSTVLNKTLDLSKQNQGILIWTVNYTPFGREIGTGLEDTLPQGIDLRTDSSGKLIWEDEDGNRNITVHKLTLKDDGSGAYTKATELTLDEVKSVIGYDSNLRKLTLIFPDKIQAYALTYVTDITGMPGNVTNAVKLVDAIGTGTSTDQSVSVTAQQGSATMGRSGYLVVKKQEMNSNSLPGAEFTLYNTNTDGSRASSRAVRTTSIDGTVKFYGLAPGNYILAETKAPDDYENPSLEYNVVVGSDLKTTVNGSGVITNSNPFVVTNYKAIDPVGSLTISKAVAGNGADTTKTFDFTLTLDGAIGTYTLVGHGVPGGTIKSGDTVSLAHGQSITIVGLPNGTTYTVTEADYTGVGYTTTRTGTTGDIVTNTTQTAAFTNTRTVGSLVIAKTVAGNAGDRSKSFNFTLTLNGAADIPYAYIGNDVPNGTIKSGDVISLAHGQNITITGLPAGTTYTVTETDYSGNGYTTVSTGATGSIIADTTQTASFTNTKSVSHPSPGIGNLTISKTVAGIGADTTKKFDFTVIFSGASDSYYYTGNGVPDGTIKSGDTISLTHGQSITITGLPSDATYQVTEGNASAQGYSVESTGSSGTISSSLENTAAFTNTKLPISTGSLTISKMVTGQGASITRQFKFTVTLTGTQDAYPYTGSASGTLRSGDTITLSSGQSITIADLPAGVGYAVTEADYTDIGYITSSTGASDTISAGGAQTAVFTNKWSPLPNKPGEPTNPIEDIGEEDIPTGFMDGGSSSENSGSMPKTGDNQVGNLAKLGLLLFSTAFVALSTVNFALRKKCPGKRTRK